MRERWRAVDRRFPTGACPATWKEAGTRELAAPSVKQRLAAIRHVFDWLVTGQVVPVNPATSVRGPNTSSRSGQTPVLAPSEARGCLILDASTHAGLRDRALIGLMAFTFARIGATIGMAVEEVYYAEPPTVVSAARDGRQAALNSVPSESRLNISLPISRRQPRADRKGPLSHVRPRTGSSL